MDNFMAKPWFKRIISLVIALLLFITVNFEMQSDNKPIGFSTSPDIDTETIENVPVRVYYDMENLVVTGIPDSVNVTLQGAKPLLTAAKNQRDFTVYVDLSDPNITLGKRTVSFKIDDLNEKLKATIDPEFIEVNVQERVTKEFPVEAEFDPKMIEDGYTAENPVVAQEKVKITGAKDEIERISFVKAVLDLRKGTNQSFNGKVEVRALDQNLNKLDVSIEPRMVDVSLKVSIPSKTVKINPVPFGNPKGNIDIESILVNPKEVTLYGKESDLEKIKHVNLEINLANIEGNTEFEAALKQPEHVKQMSVNRVKVVVRTEQNSDETNEEQSEEEEISKTLKNLGIEIVGLEDDLEATIRPKTTNITLIGSAEELKAISADDITITADVSKLGAGSHQVELTVEVPSQISWELSQRSITVSITDKEET